MSPVPEEIKNLPKEARHTAWEIRGGPVPPLFKLGPPQLDFRGPQWATKLTTTCLVW